MADLRKVPERWCPACDSLTYTQIPEGHVYIAPHWWCRSHAHLLGLNLRDALAAPSPSPSDPADAVDARTRLGPEWREVLRIMTGYLDAYNDDRDAAAPRSSGTPAPHRMDAPDGPVCGCGRPSTHASGWCGVCARSSGTPGTAPGKDGAR